MKKSCFLFLFVLFVFTGSAKTEAAILQYADNVINFSSEWSSGSWSANQALGAPNTFGYGDIPTAWAPGPRNGTLEYITVGFNTAVYADGVTIRETYGNGFVYQIDVLDSSNVLHQVWAGNDPSPAGVVADTFFGWSRTSFLVDGLKIYTDTNTHPSHWEEIDSIQLSGFSSPLSPGGGQAIPEPSTFALLGLGIVSAFFFHRRRTA